jgi:hypothetical protein
MNSLEVIQLLDGQFRDYGLCIDQIEHDHENRTLTAPIIAPDWDTILETANLLFFRKTRVQFVKWVLTIRQVQSVSIFESAVHNLSQIELGGVEFTSDNRVVIEGQYIIRIEISCDQLDLSLSKGDQIVCEQERWGIRWK